jgi:steroid delta-isomerase-like uncharacterized protein
MATAEEERNTAVVKRNYDEIWNQGKFEVAEEIVAKDFEDHPPTRFFDIGRTGPASLQEAARKFRIAFSDFHDTSEQILAEGDRVAYLGTISGTNDGELFGFPATGRKMEVRGINFFRLKDGQIIERWGQFDVLTMMQQLGLAPAPGGPGGGSHDAAPEAEKAG